MDELTPFQRKHLNGLRMIIERLDRQNELLQKRRTGRLRVFLKKMLSAFSERLSTDLGHWLGGLLPWLLALYLGLSQ